MRIEKQPRTSRLFFSCAAEESIGGAERESTFQLGAGEMDYTRDAAASLGGVSAPHLLHYSSRRLGEGGPMELARNRKRKRNERSVLSFCGARFIVTTDLTLYVQRKQRARLVALVYNVRKKAGPAVHSNASHRAA